MYFSETWCTLCGCKYSEDLRKRIVEARQRGETAQDIFTRLEVSKRTVERYWERYQTTGDYRSRRKGAPAISVLDPHQDTITGWIKEEPGLTLEQLKDRCEERLQIIITVQALW